MTTELDRGNRPTPMLRCPRSDSHLYTTLVLALRDMREANRRDPTTGAGIGNGSWMGLCLGMIVLDTLSGTNPGVWRRWEQLLTAHHIEPADAKIIWKVRCALLHGYGPPKPDAVGGRRVLFSDDTGAYAINTTSEPARIWISVPVFCGNLVERITYHAHDRWDSHLVDTNVAAVPPRLS